MTQQLQNDGMIKPGCVGLQAMEEDIDDQLRGPEQGFSGKHRDDISNQVLNDSLVAEARQKGLTYFRDKGVWEKRKSEECIKQTGRPPITVRWVDVNK